jgi:hypothetical protein
MMNKRFLQAYMLAAASMPLMAQAPTERELTVEDIGWTALDELRSTRNAVNKPPEPVTEPPSRQVRRAMERKLRKGQA